MLSEQGGRGLARHGPLYWALTELIGAFHLAAYLLENNTLTPRIETALRGRWNPSTLCAARPWSAFALAPDRIFAV